MRYSMGNVSDHMLLVFWMFFLNAVMECHGWKVHAMGEALPQKYPSRRFPSKSHQFGILSSSLHLFSTSVILHFSSVWLLSIHWDQSCEGRNVCLHYERKISNNCVRTLRIQINFHSDSWLLAPSQETGLYFGGLSPGRSYWPGEPAAIPLLAAGILLNPATPTHLPGSVQWQTKEIGLSLYTLYLIPRIIYLIAYLNGLLLRITKCQLACKISKIPQLAARSQVTCCHGVKPNWWWSVLPTDKLLVR